MYSILSTVLDPSAAGSEFECSPIAGLKILHHLLHTAPVKCLQRYYSHQITVILGRVYGLVGGELPNWMIGNECVFVLELHCREGGIDLQVHELNAALL